MRVHGGDGGGATAVLYDATDAMAVHLRGLVWGVLLRSLYDATDAMAVPRRFHCVFAKAVAMAYPGGFLVARNPPDHDLFNQGVIPLLAPTFTSHLHYVATFASDRKSQPT